MEEKVCHQQHPIRRASQGKASCTARLLYSALAAGTAETQSDRVMRGLDCSLQTKSAGLAWRLE